MKATTVKLLIFLVMLIFVTVLSAPGSGQVQGTSVKPILQTTATITGQPIVYPLFRNQITAVLEEIASGGEDGRHQNTGPQIGYVLEGSLTIDTEGFGERTFTAGQAFVGAVNTWHRTLNRGNTSLKVLLVFAREKGKLGIVRAPGIPQVGVKETTVLEATTTMIGQPILFPTFPGPIVALIGEIAPGAAFPRHLHPVNLFAYTLEGSLATELEGHTPRVFTTGQALVGPVNSWHTDANRGTVPNKFFFFFFGEEGKPLTVNP